jgi:hypothetical protein
MSWNSTQTLDCFQASGLDAIGTLIIPRSRLSLVGLS